MPESILYLCSQSHLSLGASSGYATHMREVIHSLRKAGHDVLPLIAGDELETMSGASTQRPAIIKQELKSLTPDWVWQTGRDLQELRLQRRFEARAGAQVSELRPDVVYERASFFGSVGSRLARRFRSPLVLEVNEPSAEQGYASTRSLLRAYGERSQASNWHSASRIVTVSTALKQHLVDQGIEGSKITVIPNGVNIELFDPTRVDGRSVRTQCGLNAKVVVGFAGSFYRWHAEGLRALIQILGEVRRTHGNVHLLIVGGGELTPARILGSRHQPDYVTFAGRLPHEQVPSYVAAMDIAVLPRTNWFGSPIKLFEYGALARPIVAPDAGPVRDVMEDGEDGILTPLGKNEEVRRAIVFYLDHPDEARSRGRRFQSKVRAKHTWDVVGRDVAAVCSAALG